MPFFFIQLCIYTLIHGSNQILLNRVFNIGVLFIYLWVSPCILRTHGHRNGSLRRRLRTLCTAAPCRWFLEPKQDVINKATWHHELLPFTRVHVLVILLLAEVDERPAFSAPFPPLGPLLLGGAISTTMPTALLGSEGRGGVGDAERKPPPTPPLGLVLMQDSGLEAAPDEM